MAWFLIHCYLLLLFIIIHVYIDICIHQFFHVCIIQRRQQRHNATRLLPCSVLYIRGPAVVYIFSIFMLTIIFIVYYLFMHLFIQSIICSFIHLFVFPVNYIRGPAVVHIFSKCIITIIIIIYYLYHYYHDYHV